MIVDPLFAEWIDGLRRDGRRRLTPPAPVAPRATYNRAGGALRRPRRRCRAGRLGDGDPPRPRRRERAARRPGALPARQAVRRRRSPAGRSSRRRATSTPVVERVVDTFELRLHYRRSFRRTSSRAADPDDPAAAARRLSRRAGRRGGRDLQGRRAASSSSSSAPSGVTATRRRRSDVAADVLVGADGANGIVAKAAGLDDGIVRGVALEGNVAWELLDARPLRVDRRGRARRARRGLRLAVPEGRPREPRRRRLGRAKGRTCATTSRGSRAPTAIDPDALTDVRGHRLPMRRLGASTPARDNVLLVGDAAGLVDPLSGDGMYEAFTSARLAAEAILAGDLARLRRRRWRRRSTTTPAPRGRRSARSTAIPPCASGPRARRACSASSPACCAATSGIRARRGASPGRRCGSSRASRAAPDDRLLGEASLPRSGVKE